MSSLLSHDLSTKAVVDPALAGHAKQVSSARNTAMVVDVIAFNCFDESLRNQWQSFRTTSSVYRSPFFSLEFLDATSAARSDARMIVIRKNDRVIGFLPIQLSSDRHALPLGGLFNDAHGIVSCEAEGSISYIEVLKLANLKSYTFHSLAEVTPEVSAWQYGRTLSYLADLQSHEDGYWNFLEETRATIFKQRRKTKKMVKDLGPLRLEFDCQDRAVRQQILELKRAQYRRTNIFDLLSVDWVHRVFNNLFDKQNGECKGLTSALYAGDTLVAGHVGLLEGELLHYWFPVYDPAYHVYSPGTALFLEISKACESQGIKQVDFGYGEQPYKVKLTDTTTEVSFGRFDVSRTRWHIKRCAYHLAMKRKQLPFREAIKLILRKLSPNFGAKRYQ